MLAQKKDGSNQPAAPSSPALDGGKRENTIEDAGQLRRHRGRDCRGVAKKLEEEKEVKEMRAKAEAGDGDAMCELGGVVPRGRNGLAKDKAQARAWYERSAAARDPKGMAAFGECLLLGHRWAQDNVFGIMNVTEAAGLGSDVGAMTLGYGRSSEARPAEGPCSGEVLVEEGRRRRVRSTSN